MDLTEKATLSNYVIYCYIKFWNAVVQFVVFILVFYCWFMANNCRLFIMIGYNVTVDSQCLLFILLYYYYIVCIEDMNFELRNGLVSGNKIKIPSNWTDVAWWGE